MTAPGPALSGLGFGARFGVGVQGSGLGFRV